jgi:hypothetical protein
MKNTIDGTLGTAGLSSPVWLDWLTASSALVVAVGGAILIILRIVLAWKELKSKE